MAAWGVMKCPSCATEVPGSNAYCHACGRELASHRKPVSPYSSPTLDVSPAFASPMATPQARFVPGILLAERYRIVTPVGRGGMGEVYRAEDLRLGQTVALKFLPENISRIPAAWTHLEREVRVARQISHPNVCRVFDIGETPDAPFITMEFIDGEDLASLLKRIGRLPIDKGLQVAHQLCTGLSAVRSGAPR
jgi:serine/threonine protein kinase